MRLLSVDYIFWWFTPVLMTVIALVMYRRRLHLEFPYFFNYVVFQVLSFAVEFPLRHSPTHFWVSWTTTALSVVVSFAVLLEVFKDAFRPYEALRDLSVILFRWCAIVVLLVAGMWAVTSWRDNEVSTITNGMLFVVRSVRMMQCGLVFFMLLFSEYLGVSRRNMVFGISFGLGFFAAVNMLVTTALAHHTVVAGFALKRVNSIAYIASMLIWLTYSLMPVKERVPRKVLAATPDRWEAAVDEVRNAQPAVSLLDSIDQTVDRLLYDRGTEASVIVPHRH